MSRIAPYPLRMAPENRMYLEKEAEKAKRSLQQEILYRLDKYQQIEKLLASSSSDNEDMYMQVANALRMSKIAEDRAKEIEKLNARLDVYVSSGKMTDTDRFMTINKNADVIDKAIKNIMNVIPPEYIQEKEIKKK